MDKFINVFINTFNDLMEYHDMFWSGLFLTEIYSLSRMFKLMVDKRPRDDECNESMNNIIYMGGNAHVFFVSKFIKNMFSEKLEMDEYPLDISEAGVNFDGTFPDGSYSEKAINQCIKLKKARVYL